MRGRAEVAAWLAGPAQHYIAGMTKTQTVRVVGFALIVLGGALLLTAFRRQRRVRGAARARYHRPARYEWGRYERPGWYDGGRKEWRRYEPPAVRPTGADPSPAAAGPARRGTRRAGPGRTG